MEPSVKEILKTRRAQQNVTLYFNKEKEVVGSWHAFVAFSTHFPLLLIQALTCVRLSKVLGIWALMLSCLNVVAA